MEATAAVTAGARKTAKPKAAAGNGVEDIFAEIENRVKTDGAALVSQVKGIYAFFS